MAKLVVTLVHGTWGRGVFIRSESAPWTRDISALCVSLYKRFGSDVVIRRFPWSGGNTHTARVKAAEDLSGFLENGLKEWPKAAHFVIAHSHGGNVALSAVGSPNLQARIAGVACLATPFISARPRDLGRNPLTTLAAAIVALLLFLYWLLDTFVVIPWEGLARLGIEVFVGTVLMSGASLFLWAAMKYSKKLCRELTPPPIKTEKLLIIRSPADEATGALAMFQFISQVTVRLFLLTQIWVAAWERLLNSWVKYKGRVILVGVIAFGLFTAFLFAFAALSTPGSLDWLGIAALIGSGLSLLVFAITAFLVIPFIRVEGVVLVFRLLMSPFLWLVIATLSVLLLVPFGWQVAVANLFLDVVAEPTPVGSWQTHLIEPPTSDELRAPVPPLMHMVYENPYALKTLGKWVEERGFQYLKMSS